MLDLPFSNADLDRYGYGALFVVVFVEGFGLPAPGQSLIMAGAALAAHGRLSLAAVLLVAWCAAVLGDNLGFAIGHFGGRRLLLRYGPRFGVRERELERIEGFFAHYGGAVVMAARFVELLRQLNGVVAGSIGMHWARFLLFNAIGAALWVGVWGGGVYLLGAEVTALFHRYHAAEPFVAAGVFALLALLALRAWRNLRR